MKLENIQFYSNDTYLGKFHKITIVVEFPIPDKEYNYVDYWSVAGYSLTALLQQLIEKLNYISGCDSYPDFEGE